MGWLAHEGGGDANAESKLPPFLGRVLELLVLLDEHWQKHRLGGYKLVLLHNTAFNTAEFAKSQVVWTTYPFHF